MAMAVKDWVELILSTLGGLTALSFGFGYLYSQFKEGSTKNKLDTIALLKEDVETLRAEVGELTAKVKELTQEVTNKNKQLDEAMAILQGRDPEMQAFVVNMVQYIKDTKPLIDDIKIKVLPVVDRLDQFLNKQII